MSHPEQRKFVSIVRNYFPRYIENSKILEIGSLDINGSIRENFNGCEYIGVDVGEGPGVDLVKQGQLVDFESESFDCSISCECLEHNPFWVETLSNMFRMTKQGGLVIMSCASTGRKEHGTTRTKKRASPLTVELGWEYYRNVTESDIKRTFMLQYWFSNFVICTNYYSMDTYFVGLKKPENERNQFARMSRELQRFCRPVQNLRSLLVYLAVSSSGETGVALLRRGYRLAGHRLP